MLTDPFQTEQAVNSRFFTHVRMLSLGVDFKLPALLLFSMGGRRFFFFFCCFSPLQGGGRGTETKR